MPPTAVPKQWCLTNGIDLSQWQQEARSAWFANRCTGTLKVVTGAGKTIVAFSLAETVQNDDPDMYLAVVVPTVALMNQWRNDMLSLSNLPPTAIGRIGDGHSDRFGPDCRVIIAVLASARRYLPDMVEQTGAGSHLFLVVDECHRAGSPANLRIFDTPRRYTLGLSATPERENDDDDDGEGGVYRTDYNSTKLGRELGAIIYELPFAKAIDLGVLPEFTIHHVGLALNEEEGTKYNAYTRAIQDCRNKLASVMPEALNMVGGRLLAYVSRRGDSELAKIAHALMQAMTQRKQLLYRAENRVEATRRLVSESLADRPDARIILFHESIEEAVNLYEILDAEGLPVTLEHSQLPAAQRAKSLDRFRSGVAQVLVSVKSLVEGFNVPETDLGIIVASNASPRQRIQSIGRVLRKSRDGREKQSKVAILYMAGTTDERIYTKMDWDELMGEGRNLYFAWDLLMDSPVKLDKAPRSPEGDEAAGAVDVSGLTFGEVYPGKYQGRNFSSDTKGRVKRPDGAFALNPQGVPEIIQQLKGNVGRFRVVPGSGAILAVRKEEDGSWTTLYGGVLSEPFHFPGDPEPVYTEPEPEHPALPASENAPTETTDVADAKPRSGKKSGRAAKGRRAKTGKGRRQPSGRQETMAQIGAVEAMLERVLG